MKRDERSSDNEGGHMSSVAGRVTRMPRAKLPYVVTLTHHLSEATTHSFASMREAEAFIKRNTPVPSAVLSTTYDRPASDHTTSPPETESMMNDESILARLKVIDQRLREISAEEAAAEAKKKIAVQAPVCPTAPSQPWAKAHPAPAISTPESA